MNHQTAPTQQYFYWVTSIPPDVFPDSEGKGSVRETQRECRQTCLASRRPRGSEHSRLRLSPSTNPSQANVVKLNLFDEHGIYQSFDHSSRHPTVVYVPSLQTAPKQCYSAPSPQPGTRHRGRSAQAVATMGGNAESEPAPPMPGTQTLSGEVFYIYAFIIIGAVGTV